jgi:hypothetical protein
LTVQAFCLLKQLNKAIYKNEDSKIDKIEDKDYEHYLKKHYENYEDTPLPPLLRYRKVVEKRSNAKSIAADLH